MATQPDRHKLLTPAMHVVLQIIVNQDEYIIACGSEVWAGSHRTCRNTLNKLLTLCLIKEDSTSSAGTEIYWPNGEAVEILNNPEYVPAILSVI